MSVWVHLSMIYHKKETLKPDSSSAVSNYTLTINTTIFLATSIAFCIIKGFRTIVVISTTFRPICPPGFLRVFGLLSSSLFLFPQHFSGYVLWPSSGVCRTREPSRNFELRPLLNPQGSPVLIPLAMTGYKC